MEENEKPKKRNWNWVLWWRVDQAELDEQVVGYNSLSIWKAARKVSVLCLCLSMIITTAFIQFHVVGPGAYLDVSLFGIFGAFIYFGHRWAMIAAMLLWTFEKVLTGIDGIDPAHPANGGMIVGQFVWWTAYMHAFWLAFQTEQRRRALRKAATA